MTILVIGFGSIGKRHFENLSNMGCEVEVFSRRDKNKFSSLEECLRSTKPQHVVIANETSEHGKTLDTVLNSSDAQILVEKPLYAFLPKNKPAGSERVYVAYNLRFHPLVKRLKEHLGSEKIVFWHSYVGQHLESWRPGRDYRTVYSASRELGGGPLRDLSHEIDLFQYFAKDLSIIASHGGHYSDIKSNAEDTYSLILTSALCGHGNIHMNCTDRIGQRKVTVHTNSETYFIDLVEGRWKTSSIDEVISYDRNISYVEMMKSFLNSQKKDLCTFEEAWKINVLIETAEKN